MSAQFSKLKSFWQNLTSNQRTFIVVILLLLVSIFALWVVFFRPKNRIKESSTVNTGFLLYKESGAVESKKLGSEYTEMIGDEVFLQTGNYIRTQSGVAHILLPDNSMISLDSFTEIQVNLENSKVNINQISGKTWHRVKSISATTSYNVETSETSVSSLGTKFGIENSKDITGVYVVGGTVSVGQKDGKVLRSKQDLKINQFAEILPPNKSDKLNVGELVSAQYQGRWYQRNILVDKIFDKQTNGLSLNDILGLRINKDIQKIDSENKDVTKKNNCLNLLTQDLSNTKDVQLRVKISSPAPASEFKTTDTIKFESDSFDPCVKKPIEKISWFLDKEDRPFSTNRSATLTNLSEGVHTITLKAQVDRTELSDTVNIVVRPEKSSSSSSSSVSSSISSSSSVASSSSSSSIANDSPLIQSFKVVDTSGNILADGSSYNTCFDSENSLYKLGVTFSVVVTDTQDGSLTGSSLSWTSNNANNSSQSTDLGIGISISTQFYIPNSQNSFSHIVTFTAKDKGGLSVQKKFNIILNKTTNTCAV